VGTLVGETLQRLFAGTPMPQLEVPERWTGAAMDQSASASD